MRNQLVGVQCTPLSNEEEVALRVASQTTRILMQCSACKELLYGRDCIRNLCVCPRCDYHFPLTAHERIDLLVDTGSFLEVDDDLQATGPLTRPRCTSDGPELGEEEGPGEGPQEAVVIGNASIEDMPVALAVMDARFIDSKGGTVGGEKIRRAAERAMEQRIPLVICCASGGASEQEGGNWWLHLVTMAVALARLGEVLIPCFSVLTDPCIGATTTVALLGDVILAEPGCQVGCTHSQVVEGGMPLLLSEDVFTAEWGLQHGFIDAIVHRRELRQAMARLLRLYRSDQHVGSRHPAGREGASSCLASGVRTI